jgi:lipopolysaccharide export system protein LptC
MFQRSWTRTVAPLALAVSFLATPGCQPAKPVEAQTVVPELKLEGVRFRVYRGDTLRAFGEARTASLRRDSTEVVASELEAVLPRNPAPVRVSAPAGEGVLSERVFSAEGGVTVARGQDVARTERARYVSGPDGGHVEGDDPVVVEGKGYRLHGTGFTLDPDTGEIAVRGGARLVTGLGGAR